MNNLKSRAINLDCHQFELGYCQSCTLIKENYSDSLKIKEKKLVSTFSDNINLKSIVGLKFPDRSSRNKAKLAVKENHLGEHEFGFFSANGIFSKVEDCPLHLEGINKLLPSLRAALKEFNVPAYDLESKKGELKYIIITKSELVEGEANLHDSKAYKHQYQIRFILRSKEAIGRLNLLMKKLKECHPEIKMATANIQSIHQAILEGPDEIILPFSSQEFIELNLNGIRLLHGPKSFLQVTPEIASALYSKVKDLMTSHKVNSYLDLYCGGGAFSFAAANSCKKVLGVEISKEAILLANKAISLNQCLGEVTFLAQDADSDFVVPPGFEAVGVNPPRRGVGERLLQDILKNEPQFILYSSCYVETLKRDYDLIAKNYKIIETHLFDMFPWTEHFETLMILKRRDTTSR